MSNPGWEPGRFINLLEVLFRPFYGLNIAQFYDRYYTVIDFFLYAAIFVSVAKLTLEKVFPGRAGKALAVSVGVGLALSLSIAGRSLGFSVRAFGPLAAGIMIGLVGLVLFHLCQRAGAGSVTAGSVALIIVYFTMRAIMPQFMFWLESNPWGSFLHSLLVLAILVALWRLIAALFRSPAGRLDSLARTIDPERTPQPFQQERVTDQRELGLLKHRLSRFVSGAVKESSQIIQELQEMIEIVQEHGVDRRTLQYISGKLREISPKQHRIFQQLSRIRKLDKNLRQFDLSELKDLNSRYTALSPEQKQRCQAQFLEGRAKLGIENELEQFSRAAQDYQQQFSYGLTTAVKYLAAGQAVGAIQWLEKAIEQERAAEQILRNMLALERRLIDLAAKQLRQTVPAQ